MDGVDCGDCGDCGGVDCDCNCDGCDCDCMCDSCDCNCDCNCLDNCCSGVDSNICWYFFFPSSGNGRTNSNSTPTDCSLCCCLPGETSRTRASKTPRSNAKKRNGKGFCSHLWSCFGRNRSSEPSSPSPATQDQSTMENMPPTGYKQDGRYPMNEEAELPMPHREHTLEGKWSKPVKYGQ